MSFKPEFQSAVDSLPKTTFENGVVVNQQEITDRALVAVGVDVERLKADQEAVATAAAMIAHRIGTDAAPAMVANPELKKVTGSSKIGNDEFNVAFNHTSVSRDLSSGAEVVNHLTSSMSYVSAGGRNLGLLKKVRAHHKAVGAELFGKKD